MTTVRAWYCIPKVWNMLRQLSSWHDNGQSMVIHPLGMKHAPLVVIASWQRSEHGYQSLRYETCSESCHRDRQRSEHGFSLLRYENCSYSCHRLMTTVRAWLFISKVWNMLRQLSSSHDNGQSMVIPLEGMKQAPTVDIVSWHRSENGYSSLRYETCSDSCHRDMKTVRAWLFISKVWNILRQLTSSNDNGQSMVIHL